MRSLYYLIWFGLFSLLVAPTALAEKSRSPLAPLDTRSPLAPLEKGGTRMEVPLDKERAALKVPLKKGDLGESLAQNSQLTRVTEVEVKQTPSGLQVILKTPPGQAKLVPLILPEGNNLLVEILDATLAFGIRNGVTKTNPAPGISQVKVAKIDATSVRVTITGATQQPPTAAIVSGGQNLVLNVTPKATAQTEADEEIEIVVTGQREEGNYTAPNSNVGTRTDTPIKDVPQSIQVVPQQVLKDQGETDFKDALRNVSGIAQGSNAQFFIRGFKSANSIRRNGSSANQGGGFVLGNTSLADVEQIEVLKGPAAILFGSGEPGGIVNITTKQPLSQPSYEFQGIIGNFDFYRPSLDITGPLNEDKTILYRFNAFYENSGSFTDFVENESFGFYPVLSFELGKNTTLTLEGNYREEMSNENSGLSGSDGLPARGTVLPNPVGETPRSRNLGEPDFDDATFIEWNIGYRLKHEFNSNWSINNSFTANILDQDGKAVRSGGLEADNRTVTRQFNINRDRQENYNLQTDVSGKVQTGNVQHDLLIGVELLRGNTKTLVGGIGIEAASIDLFDPVYGNLSNLNNLNVTDPESVFNERITSDSIGFYAQDLLSISEKVKILVGGRLDWNFSETEDLFTGETFEPDSVNSFSPRVGVVYQPIKSVSLYSSYSTFFLPQFELDRLGNPFDPITGRQFEVGVKNEFFDGKASATLAAFQINRRNDFTPDPVDPDNFQVQLGETRSRGIEFDLTGEVLPGLKLITTYTLTDNQIIEDDNFGTEGNTPANVPLHSGSIWAVYEVPKGEYQGFGVGAGVSAVGERQGSDDNTFTIPAYGRVDALLYYRQDKWQAQLNIENLFNEDYIEGSLTDINVIPGAPFTIRGQLSAEF